MIVARSGHLYRFWYRDDDLDKNVIVFGVFQTAAKNKRGDWFYFFDVDGEVIAYHPDSINDLKEIE